MEVIYTKQMTLAEAMEELPSRARLEVFDNGTSIFYGVVGALEKSLSCEILSRPCNASLPYSNNKLDIYSSTTIHFYLQRG
jgi:hypothetical protein